MESSLACNLACVMCPWKDVRKTAAHGGLMTAGIWEALRPHLPQVESIDLSGGGEPLLNPSLLAWLVQAKKAGCAAGFLTSGQLLDEKKAAGLAEAGADWVGFSLDGATREVYEQIRKGAGFDRLLQNVKRLASLRKDGPPKIILQCVMMPENMGQLGGMVELAADIGADQINFKQCDVIRESTPRGLSLFAGEQLGRLKERQRLLDKALARARGLGIKTTAFSFAPDELPACDMDPSGSLFVAYDGRVGPCINHAYGGATSFLGQEAKMPEVCYGRLPQQDLLDIWERSEECLFFRRRFAQRVQAYNQALKRADLDEPSLYKLNRALDQAKKAMPPAPAGCDVCHYLYDV